MGGLIVLGAGLAGLGCALESPGARIFEAANHVGGRSYSFQQGGVCFDQGAHISHTTNETFKRLTQAAAGDVVGISQSCVRNFWNGSWLTYPVQNHLHELPEQMRIAALTDLVQAHLQRTGEDPANYRQWCEAQYGTFLADHFYQVFTQKYWRSAMEDLATDWLGGRLLPSQLPRILAGAIAPQQEQQAAFARFRYPAQGGFFRFYESLYQQVSVTCQARAVEVDTQRKRVTFSHGKSEHYDQLASSIPLPVLMQIIKDAPARLVEAAQQLHCTQLLCVNVIVDRPQLTDCHWFYVYDADIDVARVSVPSNLSPASVPAGTTALQAEIFRRDDEPLDAGLLVERALEQLQRMLNFERREVRMVDHVHVSRAYVLSDHRRGPIVDELLAWLEERDIHSMGLYGRWKYVWSDVAFLQGQQTARKLKDQYHAAA